MRSIWRWIAWSGIGCACLAGGILSAQEAYEPPVRPAATVRDWRDLAALPSDFTAADPPPPVPREDPSPSDMLPPVRPDTTPSPSDMLIEPSCGLPTPGCAHRPGSGADRTAGGCDEFGGCGCAGDCCTIAAVDPIWVDRALGRAGCSPYRFGGWFQAGAVANAANPASEFNGITGYADRDRVQMDQAWLFSEKATCTGGCGWDVGGRIDFVYGTDARYLTAVGLERDTTGNPHWNAVGQDYQVALPQVYGEVAYNRLTVQVGRFASPLGYESIMSPYNFFYTRSDARVYGVPQTNFGGLATWHANENVTLLAGLTNGWDTWGHVNPWTSVLAGFVLHPVDRPWTLRFVAHVGGDDANGDWSDGAQEAPRYVYSTVFTWLINERWTYVLASDIGIQHDALGPNVDAEWYGATNYLFYCINDRWSAGARLEWFRDDDGYRVDPVDPGNPNAGPFVGHFYEITLGLNWRPTANFVVRPELRWDWFDGAGLPFDDGTSDNQFLAAVDAIWLF